MKKKRKTKIKEKIKNLIMIIIFHIGIIALMCYGFTRMTVY